MMNRFHLFLLIIWLAIVACSYPLLLYLANHPKLMLGIEQTQPGSLMRSGREMLALGNLQLAVQSFERAKQKFATLYDDTGLERHKQFVIDATIGMADSYRILGVTPEWQKAVFLYEDALKDYPDGNHGNWNLSLGMSLEQLQRYDEAIDQFNQVIEQGAGLTKLYTYYERGRSYLEQSKWDSACEDLYWFIRSQRWEISEEQWLELLRLENASNPKKHFILAFTYSALNKKEEAVAHIQRYLQLAPNDRAALYLQSSLLDQPFVQESGDIPLTEIIPPQDQTPYQLTSGMLNLYTAEPGNYTLLFFMSSINEEQMKTDSSKPTIPQVTVQCNGKEVLSYYVSAVEPLEYAVSLQLMEGKNSLELRTQDSTIDEPLHVIHIHSIQLTK